MGSRTYRTQRRRSSLLNVGRRVDYAVRALSYMAAQSSGRVVPRTEIQDRQQIPQHYLSKILRNLVAAGILESMPGARGGFRLRQPGERITLRDVYECIEGPLCLMECIEQDQAFCCFASICRQINVWRGAQAALASYLERVSIADIADQGGLARRLRDIHQSPATPAAVARVQVER